jgi:ParB-like chromosome segregation protein Spo0J
MPVNETSEERWESVDAALLSGKDLPAIEVFKVGELYFVIDGNHRVSASRIQGIEYIDAHVIEVECNEDIRSTIEARALYLDTDDEDASSDE